MTLPEASFVLTVMFAMFEVVKEHRLTIVIIVPPAITPKLETVSALPVFGVVIVHVGSATAAVRGTPVSSQQSQSPADYSRSTDAV